MSHKNRRSFLQQLGLAGAAVIAGNAAIAHEAPAIISPLHRPPYMPDDQPIRMGLIGAGGMGTEDMKSALMHAGVTITAVCDLYKGRIDAAKQRWGQNIFATNDYKNSFPLRSKSPVD